MRDEHVIPKKPGYDVRGDEKAMPDKGTSTGVIDTYGADVGQDARNRKGSAMGGSDPMDMDMPAKQR